MDPVVILRRQVRDEVSAALQPSRDVRISQQLRKLEQIALGLDQLTGGGQTTLDDGSVGGRYDLAWPLGDRAQAGPQATREELVEAGVVFQRLLGFGHVDPIDARETGQHEPSQAGWNAPTAAPPDRPGYGAFGDDSPHRAPSPIAER